MGSHWTLRGRKFFKVLWWDQKKMNMRKPKLMQIPLSQIEIDPLGDMLSDSESIKPYINHYCALMTDGDSESTKVIAECQLRNDTYLALSSASLGISRLPRVEAGRCGSRFAASVKLSRKVTR
jgi:hypothetical protein